MARIGNLFRLRPTRPSEPYQTKTSGQAVSRRSFPVDQTVTTQGRATTTGADASATEIVAASAGTDRVIEIWLDSTEANGCHIGIGEDADTSNPFLQPGDSFEIATDEKLTAIREDSQSEVTMNVLVYEVDS